MMAFRASAAKKIKIKNLPKIELGIYSKIALNKLVVYAVQYLQEQGVTATVEEIVSVCFRLFPHSFSLKHYPRWPDSALVIRRLNNGREKGNIKGTASDGFSMKYKGKLLAKRVARALGLAKPATVKVKKKTAPVKKKSAPVKSVKTQGMKTKVVPQKKKSIAPAVVKKSPKKQMSKLVKKIVPKSIKPARQMIRKKAVISKQETLSLKKTAQKPGKKSVKFPAPVPVKKKKLRKQRAVKTARPAQLSMALPLPQEKKVKPVQPVKRKRKVIAPQPEKTAKISPAAANHVSREEKAKAKKVIRLMELSDAYRHYKKNGSKSRISEFDFRSLLLCTMESPPETLARNVNLFRGYVNIHNRRDLTNFLNFCEESFASLLKPTGTKIKKKQQPFAPSRIDSRWSESK